MGECLLPVIAGGSGGIPNPNIAYGKPWMHGYYRDETLHTAAYKNDKSAGWMCNAVPLVLNPQYNYYFYTAYMDYYGYIQACLHTVRLENQGGNLFPGGYTDNTNAGQVINPQSFGDSPINAYVSVGGLVDGAWKHIYVFVVELPKTVTQMPIDVDLGFVEALDSYDIVINR